MDVHREAAASAAGTIRLEGTASAVLTLAVRGRKNGEF